MYSLNCVLLNRSHRICRNMSIKLPLSKIDRAQQDSIVLKPLTHVQRTPSADHQKLYRSFNYWLKVPANKLKPIEATMHMLHSASLLMDDIQDDSTFRYKAPVAHIVYGPALTINATSHAVLLATQEILALEPKAIGIFLEALIDGHRGQGIDIHWRDNMICPSEEEYMDMITQKSSVLFILAYRLQQIFSENQVDYSKLANLVGIYYQIRDDYCNLQLQKNADNKTYCSDITEGKFSLPIIYAIHHSANSREILNILKRRTQDQDLKTYCVSLLKKVGSFKYTCDLLNDMEDNIYKEIKQLGGNPDLEAVMGGLGNWRQYGNDNK